jgi:hypothetical protein
MMSDNKITLFRLESLSQTAFDWAFQSFHDRGGDFGGIDAWDDAAT